MTALSSSTEPEEAAAGLASEGRYGLQLYVAGSTSRSMQAVKNIRRVCEQYLAGRYDLEVIDIYQNPETAAQAQIIAAPTLIKMFPEPRRRAIGDLSNVEKVLFTLNLDIDHVYGT
jgi:circadian clock protein KaiB